ncbi:DUF664 domain-containing protein [Brachybacterium sp. YJGR34]|uniref:mycothiol transferase n=1 Tax=Brachybacterium sp. YJGR34 TaxID=2059911 RepID=UPI000E0ABE62|nr:DUF664 domain-containing protein [Brachybacterium sp. YJGR34]
MQDPELREQLDEQRRHVLEAVGGLDEEQLRSVRVPSGWSIAQLLGHLTYDDEMFWIGAVLGAEPRAISGLRDGWSHEPATGHEAVARYRAEIERSDEVLARCDLSAPPRWVPPPSVFDAPIMADGRGVLFRMLSETAVHAGHLDIVRELIDGRRHLVVP